MAYIHVYTEHGTLEEVIYEEDIEVFAEDDAANMASMLFSGVNHARIREDLRLRKRIEIHARGCEDPNCAAAGHAEAFIDELRDRGHWRSPIIIDGHNLTEEAR